MIDQSQIRQRPGLSYLLARRSPHDRAAVGIVPSCRSRTGIVLLVYHKSRLPRRGICVAIASRSREFVQGYLEAQQTAEAAHAFMTGAIIAAAAGSSESALSADLGLNRRTIRKALGKRG